MGVGQFIEGMPEEWRQFAVMRLFGWTEAEYAAATAQFCDRALQLESLEAEAAEARSK